MKRRLRYIAFLLVAVLIVTIAAACGKGAPEESQSSSEPAQTETEKNTEAESESETEAVTEAPTEEETEEEIETEAPMQFTDVNETVWAVSQVNIRSEYNTTCEIMGVLEQGQSLTRTGIGEGWSRVIYDDMICFIASDYLTTQKVEPPVPETTVPSSGQAGIGIVSGSGGHIVAIDPGHQGHGNSELEPIAPGSTEMKAKVAAGATGVATGMVESQLNLTVSLQLKAELLARGYTVVMIRETQDVNISNAERAQIASNSGAEVLLRVHGNSVDNQSVHGIVTMTPSRANPYVGHMYDACMSLNSNILNHMLAATGARNAGLLEVDNMSGINWSTIPVSIIELGFMSNPEEDVRLCDPSYQSLLVQGIANGVDAYFGQ